MAVRCKATIDFAGLPPPPLHQASRDRRERKLSMRLCNLAVIALLAYFPAGARAELIVMAAGNTIGDQGFKQASAAISGGDPSVVAIQSIQNGDVFSGLIHLEASLLGSGVATYGTLAASLEAQARNQAAFSNLYEPSASGILRMSFADGAIIVSDTLPLGTPVVLTFVVSLASDFIATGRAADPTHNGATAEFNGTVTDTTTGSKGVAIIVNGVAGATPPSVTFKLETEVGRALQLTGKLELGVEARALNMDSPDGGDVLATSTVGAAHTAHLIYQAFGDVKLVSDSGHDYTTSASAAVPEPGSFCLAGLGVAAIFLGRRRHSNQNG